MRGRFQLRSDGELGLRVHCCCRSAACRPFSRAECCFWRWAARGRPDFGLAGRGRRCGRPPLFEALGRPPRGWPPVAAPRGWLAAEARGCGDLLRGARFSGGGCERRSAFGRLADSVRVRGGGSVGPGDSGAEGALCGAPRGCVPRPRPPRPQAWGPGVYGTHESRSVRSKVVIFWAVPSHSQLVANPAGFRGL